MRRWLRGPRRLMLKSQYLVHRLNERVRARFHRDTTLPLETVQRRLELLLAAVYGRAIPLAPTEHEAWTRARVRRLASRDRRALEATPSVDGETIFLPPMLETGSEGHAGAIARYRLIAIEQAERLTRGTAVHAPVDDPLERDLYLLRESAAIDAHIAQAHPGMTDTLRAERLSALNRRPKLDALTPAERNVEQFVRETLQTPPERLAATSHDPVESLEWARRAAEDIRRSGGIYRGLPPAAFWGKLKRTDRDAHPPTSVSSLGVHNNNTENTETERAEARHGESLQESGKSTGSDPRGDGRPDDNQHDAKGDASGENARNLQVEDPWNLPSGSDGTIAGAGTDEVIPGGTLAGLPAAIRYDEWDSNHHAYVKRAAAVRLYEPNEGEERWARETLARHAAVVRRVRQEFERLRARRTLLARQRAGDEIDIAACVNAIVDRRIGDAPDDRLYLHARPARRGLAISLLVDVSGSTETQVTSEWRIVDLEKIAVLLATQALDALGDLYAVYSFSGKTAQNVRMTAVKNFGERSGDTVHRRIAGLEPGGFTRLGAAVRHATRELARQSAGHRLLLLLSDGRPNDVDGYQGSYAVEDSRQAIFEARASGVFPFCLTVDHEASEYLPRIFGQAGHTILQRPEQLPTALLGAVRALIRRR